MLTERVRSLDGGPNEALEFLTASGSHGRIPQISSAESFPGMLRTLEPLVEIARESLVQAPVRSLLFDIFSQMVTPFATRRYDPSFPLRCPLGI